MCSCMLKPCNAIAHVVCLAWSVLWRSVRLQLAELGSPSLAHEVHRSSKLPFAAASTASS